MTEFLEHLSHPHDLKDLSTFELSQLADEIRLRIIEDQLVSGGIEHPVKSNR